MRKIEFRGKCRDTGDWIYGSYVKTGVGLHYIIPQNLISSGLPMYAVDPETIGYNIGLKDKNGSGIFEGDILTSSDYPYQDEGQYNYHGVIEWIDESVSFCITKRLANSKKRGISDGISEQIEDATDFEVIGNIHDNPELLEVAE